MAIVGVLAGVTSLVSLVCWVMTLITMAQDSEKGGVGHAVGGFFCGLYALIWGWQNKERHGREQLMMIWAGAMGAGVVLNVIGSAIAS